MAQWDPPFANTPLAPSYEQNISDCQQVNQKMRPNQSVFSLPTTQQQHSRAHLQLQPQLCHKLTQNLIGLILPALDLLTNATRELLQPHHFW